MYLAHSLPNVLSWIFWFFPFSEADQGMTSASQLSLLAFITVLSSLFRQKCILQIPIGDTVEACIVLNACMLNAIKWA